MIIEEPEFPRNAISPLRLRERPKWPLKQLSKRNPVMKRTALLAAAATFAFAMPSIAAELGVKAGANAGVKAGSTLGASSTGSTTSGNMSAAGSADANFGAAVSAMNNTASVAQEIQTLANVEAVTIVDVDTLAQGQNDSALTNAESRNQAEIENLHAAIESNSAVMAAIEEKNGDFDVDNVVAADITADGSLVIYTQG
jgi:hypothetical protein